MVSKNPVQAIPEGADELVPRSVRAGGLILTSSISGIDAATGRLGESPEEQFDLAFQNLRRVLDEAQASTDNVGYLTVFIRDQGLRPLINKPWLAMFPNEEDRPARKTTQHPLPTGFHVQLQAFAVEGTRRQVIHVPGMSHRDPLPVGVRLGDMVYSSVIVAQDPATGEAPEDPRQQIDQAFENMRTLVEAAGGTNNDIAHVWVFLKDFTYQPHMVDVWLRHFPEDGNRPARKTFRYDLAGGAQIQLQFTAVLGGRSGNFEVEGIGHQDPIPLGARAGNLFFSSGVGGYEPVTGRAGKNLEEQAEFAFESVRRLMAVAGGSTANIAQLTILLRDFADEPGIMKAWHRLFPAGSSRPARHLMPLGISSEMLMQLHVIGAF